MHFFVCIIIIILYHINVVHLHVLVPTYLYYLIYRAGLHNLLIERGLVQHVDMNEVSQ